MERKLNGYELIALDDFKDTSYTTDSADVVIALYYPYREKIPKCEGYPIQNILKGRFRLCQILKKKDLKLKIYNEVQLSVLMVTLIMNWVNCWKIWKQTISS